MTFVQQFNAYKTILTKEYLRFIRIWVQTIIPPAITVALYFIIFGNLIGPRIGDIEGFTYMEFIVPGLIMMSIIASSYSNVVSSFYSSKFQRHIEEIALNVVHECRVSVSLRMHDALAQVQSNRLYIPCCQRVG